MHRSLKWRLVTGALFEDFMLIYPFYQLMMLGRGVSIGQISGLFILWSSVSIIAEIPTGVLADRVPRKYLLVAAQLLRALAFGIWVLVPNIWGYALGFVMWGIGGAFHSGTYQALLFDELAAVGLKDEYVWWQGRLTALGELGLMLCAFVGAATIKWGYDGVGAISILTALVIAYIYATLPVARPQELIADTSYWRGLREGIAEALKSPAILRLAVMGAVVGSVYGVLDEYTPVYSALPGLVLWQISLLQGLIGLAVIGGSLLAHRWHKLTDGTFTWALVATGTALVVAALPWRLPGFAAVMVGFGLLKLLEVVYDGRLQHEISSHRRATITSVGGFMAEVLSIGLYGIIGLIADWWGVLAAFGFVGGLVCAFGAGFGFRLKRQHSFALLS